MTANPNRNHPRPPAAVEKTRTLMFQPQPRRAWRIAGTGVLALALTTALATWPWQQADIPAAEAQEETTATDGVADTEAEALEEAAASGESVEVLSLRSELRDVSAEPDGTFIATEYTAPVRTIVDGAWADIDPTLTVAADGTITPKATTVQMVFSAGGDEPLVTLAKNSHVMTLDWAGDLPEPVVEGDTAVYAEVLPGVDLHLTALDGGFTHTLVVKSAQAATNPDLASIEWPVTLDGSAVETTPAGGVSVVDAGTLDAWLSADSPTMWDSTGVAEAVETIPYLAGTDLADQASAMEVAAEFGRQAEVGITGSGSAIVLTPDQGLLTGADTVYPVYIDPVYRDEFRTAQAMVASEFPSEEYWNWTGDQGVGYCGVWANCDRKRIFYRVSSSFYKSKTILSATFGATLRHNYYNSNQAHYADLYLTGGISSATNWSNQPSGSKIDSANTPAPSGGDCDYVADHATEWDVLTEVRNAAAKGTSTLTFGVRNASETDYTRWMRFCNNGHLRVHYNTPPNQPDTADMYSSPGPACQWAIDADSYVNKLPILRATLTDADHGDTNEWGSAKGSKVSEHLRANFRVFNLDGTQLYDGGLTSAQASGSEFELNLATAPGFPAIASGTTLRWAVRATDGTSYSPWSHTGSYTCRFVYDATAPVAPTITSTDFPDRDAITPMVGEIGSLSLATTDTDIVAYKVDFNKDSEGVKRIDLATVSADAKVEFLPMVPGRHLLTVVALDAAGNSASNTYAFRVSVGDPAGVWALTDAAGSADVADADGSNPGTPGSGVTFGAAGPGIATAASFDGTANAYIDTGAYDVALTGEGVAIAAWARVDDLTQDGVIASIDGGIGEAGIILGYRSTSATGGRWVLSMPDMAIGSFTSWEVFGGQVTATNQDEWVHLTGTWNDYTGELTLYVNGVAAGSTTRQTTWWGDGTVQIGRANIGGVWDDHFTGSIADVRVFDRVVPAGEALELGWQLAIRNGYWQMNEVGSDTVSSPEYGGGLSAVLSGGAIIDNTLDELESIYPLNGTGHLALNGVDGYASVTSPMIDTSRSFTLTARVRLDTAAPSESMTVLSIPGTNASAIEVGYNAASGLWELRLTASDDVDVEPIVVASAVTPTAESQGQAIAVVFDAITGQARLYVNGDGSEALNEPLLTSWTATGGLQIGRGYTGGYFAGAIDEVRAYSGVLHPTVVGQLIFPYDEHPEI